MELVYLGAGGSQRVSGILLATGELAGLSKQCLLGQAYCLESNCSSPCVIVSFLTSEGQTGCVQDPLFNGSFGSY